MKSRELKTRPTKQSVKEFLSNIEPIQKREDSLVLLQIFKEITGSTGKMWGASIVGFGNYSYTTADGKEHGWMRTGFSPRKQNLTLYVMPGYQFQEMKDLLDKLGPHKLGKSCLYIKRLSEVDLDVLKQIIAAALEIMEKKYGA